MISARIVSLSDTLFEATHLGLEDFAPGLSEEFWKIYLTGLSINRDAAESLARRRLEDVLQTMNRTKDWDFTQNRTLEIHNTASKNQYSDLTIDMMPAHENGVVDRKISNAPGDIAELAKNVSTLDQKGVLLFGQRAKRRKSRLFDLSTRLGFVESKVEKGVWHFEKIHNQMTARVVLVVEHGGYSTSIGYYPSLWFKDRGFMVQLHHISPQLIFLVTSSLRLRPDSKDPAGYRWGRQEHSNECLFNAAALFFILDRLITVIHPEDILNFGRAEAG